MSGGEIKEEISERASIQSTSELDEKRRKISIDIIGMLHQSRSNIPKSYISRVHSELRSVNEKAYEPVLVSIGPYYYERRKSDLRTMETHKLRYLGDLIKRRKERDGPSEADQLCEYVKILEELEDQACSYYEEAVTLGKDAFIKMLLVDACFIIELFQRDGWSNFQTERETDPLFKAGWIVGRLQRDLILVENQIPFFVLERLYPIIGDVPDPLAFIYLAVNYLPIYRYISRATFQVEFDATAKSIVDLCEKPFVHLPPASRTRKLDRTKLEGFKHLLDLTRKFMLIEEILEIKDKSALQKTEQDLRESKEATPANYKKYTYSATVLRDLGVRFKGVEKSKFYEIRFENGVLEIPVFNIDDITETYFRNLIAYEEHGHCEEENIYIGNYMSFMDGLIDTAKDVELLRHRGIIDSLLGDDEEIATIFNNVGKHKTLKSYYYGGIVQQLTDHCRKRRHVWMAKLKRNHLSSPWAIISLIAAIILLILTVIQTVYSALSYNKA